MGCTRGGPALVDEPRTTGSIDVTGDPHRRLIPHTNVEVTRDGGGRSHGAGGTLDITWRARTNLDVLLGALARNATTDAFFFGRFGAPRSDTVHFTFAQLDQPVRSLTARLHYTLSPALSLQWYSQAYLSRGAYSNVRELADPRARRYAERFRVYGDTSVSNNPQGVDFRQFRSNAVMRWEYRPGSTLFVVWTQGRNRDARMARALRIGPDLRGLFGEPANNVIARYVHRMAPSTGRRDHFW